jgi:hypothetical protein
MENQKILYRKNNDWDSIIIKIYTNPGDLLKEKIIKYFSENCNYQEIDIIEFQVINTEYQNKLELTILVSFAIINS